MSSEQLESSSFVTEFQVSSTNNFSIFVLSSSSSTSYFDTVSEFLIFSRLNMKYFESLILVPRFRLELNLL